MPYTSPFTQTDDVATEATTAEQAVEAPKRKTKDTTRMPANANEDRFVLSLTLDDVQQSTNEVTLTKDYEVIASHS